MAFKPATSLTEAEYRRLWAMVSSARKNHKDYMKRAEAARDLVAKGRVHELDDMPAEDLMVANLAHSHLKTKLPTIFFQNPSANVRPTAPRYEAHADTWKQVINAVVKKIGFKKEATKAVRDAIVYPEGWLKHGVIGLDAEIEHSGEKGPQPFLNKQTPHVVRVAPQQVVVDYMSEDRSLERARFVDIQYLKTLDELKHDDKYKDIKTLTDKDAFEVNVKDGASEVQTDILDTFNKHAKYTSEKYYILHEIWVHDLPELQLRNQLIVLLEGANDKIDQQNLRASDSIESWTDVLGDGHDEYPLSRLVLNEVPDELPQSDIQIMSTLQSGVNWLMTRLIQSVENHKQIYAVNTSLVEDSENLEEALMDKGPYKIMVRVNGDVNQAVQQVSSHQTTRDESVLMNLTLEMIRRVTGVSENKMGGDNFRTATAASQAAQSDAIKVSFDQDQVAEFLKDAVSKIAKSILSLSKKAGNARWVLNVGGDTGPVDWVEWTPQDLAWMPEIDIEVNSYLKPTKEETTQKLMMGLQAMLNSAQAGVSGRTDLLVRQILESLEVRDIHKILNDGTDDTMVQTMEIVQMAMGLPVQVNPGDNHQVHIDVIRRLMGDPTVAEARQQNPQIFFALEQHMQEHMEALGQGTGGNIRQSLNGQDNPFNVLNEANAARSATASEREATDFDRQPGAGGQF